MPVSFGGGAATSDRRDGRTLRSLRTRTAVVDALLALIDEGDLRPPAPRIAERAGVSLRSVFQHFRDLEGLFAFATDRQLERIGALVRPLPTTGPLNARLDAFVEQRVTIYEAVTPVRRAALAQEPFSPHAVVARDRILAVARAELERTFADELLGGGPELLEALDAAASWQLWEALRNHQGLDVDGARKVLRRLLHSLLFAPST
ncbi:MAG TPA: TetR/AcrR family transcriptional regulator [Acidimicrobiales bacterium]|nr:TetR/AcrR family transcriptional regulator [Acidimicrobiales bacterium]